MNNKKILLVEDDLYTRELYLDLLQNEGFLVTPAVNGEIGLGEAIKGGYDLILLDIMMPKKDGITFLKEYQTSETQKPNGQIIMLTNVGEDAIIKTCMELGATGFLIKSALTPDEVLREVKNYLSASPPN